MARDVEGYLNAQISKNNSFLDDWNTMKNYYSKRLWHQLTLHVEKIVASHDFKEKNNLPELYENFIADFEHRINPLSLAEIIIPVSEKIIEKDPNEAINLLEKVREKVSSNKEAQVLCSTTIGMIKLTRLNDLKGTRELIESTESDLNDLPGVTSVHARFYMLSSHYQKNMGNKALYYQEALRYLGCADLKAMPLEEKRQWGTNLALAAILGKDIYNFGELLMHEVLQTLKGTEIEWLYDLVYAFNRGAITSLDSLASKWKSQPDLAAAEILLKEKMTLLCLMEMVFRRPANERTFTFGEISSATGLNLDQVEYLVMRALSKNLVKGRINQVNENVCFTWVQPRVLDLDQISVMKSRLETWNASVGDVRNFVKVHASDILT